MSSNDADGGDYAVERGQSTGELRTVSAAESAEDDRPRADGNARLAPFRYRRAALGLVAVGALFAAGGVVFSGAREVLFSLAATGLFGGVLAIVLSSDRFTADAIAAHVYDSTAKHEAAFVEALDLSDEQIYVPAENGVLLYVPANDEQSASVESPRSLSTDETPGLVLEPTGSTLVREVDRTVPNDLEPGLETTAGALTEGLVEILEIARKADATVDPIEGVVTVGVSGNSFGRVDRFDHPIGSYLAVGLARELERRVTLEVRRADGRADWLVTCSWDPDV